MSKILVNAPTGVQEIIEISDGGGYFDETLVLWDERVDGEMSEVTLGGMVRVGDDLVLNEALLSVHTEKADGREAEAVRTERDSRLALTDFHGLTDMTMSEAMTTYRQALRDVPQQDEFPNEINWPVVEPNEITSPVEPD